MNLSEFFTKPLALIHGVLYIVRIYTAPIFSVIFSVLTLPFRILWHYKLWVGIATCTALTIWLMFPRKWARKVSIVWATIGKDYSEEQRLALENVEEAVSSYATLAASKKKSNLSSWNPTDTPDKPSLEEIKSTLHDAEKAVGADDARFRMALDELCKAALSMEDWDLYEKAATRNIEIAEHMEGKEARHVLDLLDKLARAYYCNQKFKEAIAIFERLEESWKNSPSLWEYEKADKHLNMTAMLAISHMMNSQMLKGEFYTAETYLKRLIPLLEERFGPNDQQFLGTQHMMSFLQFVYMKQSYKHKDENLDDGVGGDPALRYLRDATETVRKLSVSRVRALRKLARLYLWLGRQSDGEAALRLANACVDPSETSTLCLCCKPPVVHEQVKCDACSKGITESARRFFCRTCTNVDLCCECFEGGVEEWQDMEKFPRGCLEHEFGEIRIDGEKEIKWKLETWVEDVCQRLTVEIESGHKRGGESELNAL